MRFAVIGSNFIVEDFLSAAKLCNDFELTTVYSRSMDNACRLAKGWGAPYYTDSIAALATSKDVDAVYVASPNICHAPQSMELLRGSKHVLCEKPIARDSEQLAEMLETARRSGTLLLEAMRPAHIPTLELLRETMKRLGTVRRVNLSYCQYSTRYDLFKSGQVENAFNPALYNGALMDIGVYCVHQMIMLLGVPKRICAMGSFLPHSIDASGSALCDYDSMQAYIAYSKVNKSDAPSEIQGEQGTLFFAPTATPYDVWIVWNDGTKEVIPTTGLYRQDMRYELQNFIEMAGGGGSPKKFHDYSIAAMKVMDEMRKQIGIDFVAK